MKKEPKQRANYYNRDSNLMLAAIGFLFTISLLGSLLAMVFFLIWGWSTGEGI